MAIDHSGVGASVVFGVCFGLLVLFILIDATRRRWRKLHAPPRAPRRLVDEPAIELVTSSAHQRVERVHLTLIIDDFAFFETRHSTRPQLALELEVDHTTRTVRTMEHRPVLDPRFGPCSFTGRFALSTASFGSLELTQTFHDSRFCAVVYDGRINGRWDRMADGQWNTCTERHRSGRFVLKVASALGQPPVFWHRHASASPSPSPHSKSTAIQVLDIQDAASPTADVAAEATTVVRLVGVHVQGASLDGLDEEVKRRLNMFSALCYQMGVDAAVSRAVH